MSAERPDATGTAVLYAHLASMLFVVQLDKGIKVIVPLSMRRAARRHG